ncbi:MAG: hypothetical protein Q9165_002628 [Trypethelium subeluteriae]
MAMKHESSLSFAILEDPVAGLPTPDSDIDRSFDDLITYTTPVGSNDHSIYQAKKLREPVKGQDDHSDSENQPPEQFNGVSFNSPASDATFSPAPPSEYSAISDHDEHPQTLPSPSRRISAVTMSSISEMEPEDRYPIQYTPIRNRALFRSPNTAVDAMHIETSTKNRTGIAKRRDERAGGGSGLHGSPLTYRSSPRQASPALRNSPDASERGSPRNVKGVRSARSPRSTIGTVSQNPTPAEKQRLGPLVLLHTTVLQSAEPEFSDALLSEVLPSKVLNTYKASRATLTQKIGPVVRQRGILLRHPRDDFNELLERIMTSLDLENTAEVSSDDENDDPDPEHQRRTCGQKCDSSDESEDDQDSDDTVCETYCPTPQLSRRPGESERICSTCGRPRRFLRIRENTVSNQYDVKVYAANGLIGHQVWEAVWQEMERVDVEINVALPEKWRRLLNEKAKEIEENEENEENEEMMNDLLGKDDCNEEKTGLPVSVDRNPSCKHSDESEIPKPRNHAHESQQNRVETKTNQATREGSHSTIGLDVRSVERAYTVKRSVSCENLFQMFENPSQTPRSQESPSDVPLSDLLKNYMWLLAQDSRNFVLFVLVLAAGILLVPRATNSPKQIGIVQDRLADYSLVSPAMEVTILSSSKPTEEITERMTGQVPETLSALTSNAAVESSTTSFVPEEKPTIEPPKTEIPPQDAYPSHEDLLPEPPEPPEPRFPFDNPTTGRMDQSMAEFSLPLPVCCLGEAVAVRDEEPDEEDAGVLEDAD